MRLVRAASELRFIDHALTEVARTRDAKDPQPSIDEVKAAFDIAKLYAEDQEFPDADGDADTEAEAE